MAEELNPELGNLVRSLKGERGPCPDADTLVAYHALDTNARARHAIDAHVRICSRCQLVLLHLTEPASAATRIRWALPAAAVLVAALAGVALYQSWPPTEIDTVRGTTIQPVAPAGPLSAVKAFEWQSPIRAARYRVTVRRGSETVWTATTDATRLVLVDPPPFEPSVEYTWRVEALDSAGDVRMSSPTQAFTVRP